MVGLGLSTGATSSIAHAISADGSIVVGFSSIDGVFDAFLWDEAGGMRSLEEVLINDYGLDIAGWNFQWRKIFLWMVK